jgi:rhodanese-related sulfurtransferase
MDLNTLLRLARREASETEPDAVAGTLADYLVLDVREPQEVLYGFLPYAVNVPRGILEQQVSGDAAFRDRRRPILVYSGKGVRSLLACATLKQLGFANVSSLAGGIERWRAEDLPIH